MALIKCTECGHEVSDKASVCPNCGCPMGQALNSSEEKTNYELKPERRRNVWMWVLMAILLSLLASGGYFAYRLLTNGDSQDTNSSTANEVGTEVLVEITPEFAKAMEKYDQLGIFNEGYAAVCRKGKWGYINHKGEEVIPSNIKAICAGRFSEGLAFVLNDWDHFSVIDIAGKSVFSADLNVGLEPTRYESSDMPYYIGGLIYVPCFDENVGVKFVVYDKSGEVVKNVSDKEGRNVYRQHEVGDYTTFSQEVEGANGFPTVQRGVKDAVGNVVIEPKYDFVLTYSIYDTDWLDNEYRHKIQNGVVLVVLLEDNDEDELSYEGVVRHYAYANLRGNDTFSDDVREKIAQSDPLANHYGEDDDAGLEDDGATSRNTSASHGDLSWIRGNWRCSVDVFGVMKDYRVGISDEYISVFMGGEHYYTGPFQVSDDMITFKDSYLLIDFDRRVIKADRSTDMHRF